MPPTRPASHRRQTLSSAAPVHAASASASAHSSPPPLALPLPRRAVRTASRVLSDQPSTHPPTLDDSGASPDESTRLAVVAAKRVKEQSTHPEPALPRRFRLELAAFKGECDAAGGERRPYNVADIHALSALWVSGSLDVIVPHNDTLALGALLAWATYGQLVEAPGLSVDVVREALLPTFSTRDVALAGAWEILYNHFHAHPVPRVTETRVWHAYFVGDREATFRQWLSSLRLYRLYNPDRQELRRLYADYQKLGADVVPRVSIVLVDPASDAFDRERDGRWVLDTYPDIVPAADLCDARGVLRKEYVTLPHARRVAPLTVDGITPPQLVLVFERTGVKAAFGGLIPPENTFLDARLLRRLDLSTVHSNPSLVFALVHVSSHPKWRHVCNATLLQKLRNNVDHRRNVVRAASRGFLGQCTGGGVRVDQRGKYGTYSNFHSSVDELQRRLIENDADAVTDYAMGVFEGVFPGLVQEQRLASFDAHLPLRGMHRTCVTAGLALGYMSWQHREAAGDPIWTMGANLARPPTCPTNHFNFAVSALNGGHGIIAENRAGTLMMWHGEQHTHGTCLGPTLPREQLSPDMLPSGIAVYLKKRTLHTNRHRQGYWWAQAVERDRVLDEKWQSDESWQYTHAQASGAGFAWRLYEPA